MTDSTPDVGARTRAFRRLADLVGRQSDQPVLAACRWSRAVISVAFSLLVSFAAVRRSSKRVIRRGSHQTERRWPPSDTRRQTSKACERPHLVGLATHPTGTYRRGSGRCDAVNVPVPSLCRPCLRSVGSVHYPIRYTEHTRGYGLGRHRLPPTRPKRPTTGGAGRWCTPTWPDMLRVVVANQ
jgi:hypothetical protein